MKEEQKSSGEHLRLARLFTYFSGIKSRLYRLDDLSENEKMARLNSAAELVEFTETFKSLAEEYLAYMKK